MMSSVLVLGGGFAGLSAARRLARDGRGDVAVHLIDQREQHVFSPLLPDLVSARIRARSMLSPIAPFCRRYGVRYTPAEVQAIFPDEGRVVTDRGEHAADFILLATGCVTNYFGKDEMAQRTLGLKSIDEGERIHHRLCELIDRWRDGRGPSHAVVVGGGYTGFECASHAAHLIHRRARLPFDRIGEVCRVTVVEQADKALGNVSPRVHDWACRLMSRYGIEILTGTTIDPPDDHGRVTLSDGRILENAVVIWAAGVTPGPAVATFQPERLRGRVAVDEHLRVKGRARLFAAGDVGAPCRPGESQPLRMGVQFSLAGGDCAARNILNLLRDKPLRTFNPYDPGYLIPVAPHKAAGIILGHEMCGLTPSLAHYFMCVLRTWRWRERMSLLRDLL